MIKPSDFVDFYYNKYGSHPIQWERAFYHLQNFSLNCPDNKSFVKEFKKVTEDFLDLNHQQNFEDLSELGGFKSYNQSSAASFNFYSLFNPLERSRHSSLILPLDEAIGGGFNQNQMTIIGSGTNMGKTQLLVSLGSNFIRQKLKVYHLSLEGVARHSLNKYVSNLSKINFSDLSNPEGISKSKLKKVSKHNKCFKLINMTNFGVNIKQVREKIEQDRQTFEFDVLMIDYPQLMAGTNLQAPYQDQMMEVFKEIKAMTKDFNCMVFCPIQLTRAITQEESWGEAFVNHYPTNQFFALADNVFCLSRPQDQASLLEILKAQNQRCNKRVNLDWIPSQSLFFESRK